MRSITSAAPARKILGTFGTLATPDDDGVKTSIASSTLAVTYDGGELDGALITDGALEAARNVTVTKAAAVGAYVVGSEVVVSGYHWKTKLAISETHTVTHADNAETFTGSVLFAADAAYPISIAIEGQADTDGSWKFGVGAAVAIDAAIDWIRITTAGNLAILLAEDIEVTSPLSLVGVTVGQDLPYSVASIHEGTTAAFAALSAGV